MPNHANYFETLKEAHIRLRGTIVLYDGIPYYVMAITDHKKDGIFRIYLDPIGWDENQTHQQPAYHNFSAESSELGDYMDKWMDDNPSAGVIRKQMNSPLFDKYRPFPLGMANVDKKTYYVERQPTRATYQGLTRASIAEHLVTLGEQPGRLGRNPAVSIVGLPFKECILGQYPTAEVCLANLTSGEYENEAAAFHRSFAFIRGPIDMLFLAYKTDVIGILPNSDFSVLRLGKNYKHTKEAVEELHLFNTIS